MTEGMDVLLALRRLRWLGHVGRMEADRLPKQILLGELLSARPFHGPKLRWRDVVLRDLWIIGFDATSSGADPGGSLGSRDPPSRNISGKPKE